MLIWDFVAICYVISITYYCRQWKGVLRRRICKGEQWCHHLWLSSILPFTQYFTMNELLELFVGCCLVAVSASERLTILAFLNSLRNCTVQHVVPFWRTVQSLACITTPLYIPMHLCHLCNLQGCRVLEQLIITRLRNTSLLFIPKVYCRFYKGPPMDHIWLVNAHFPSSHLQTYSLSHRILLNVSAEWS